MSKLSIPEPISCGLFLTYKCNSSCKHCMYACSPKWPADWISIKDAEKILSILARKLKSYHLRYNEIGINYGLHFSGGEPFLNFELLVKLTEIAHKLQIHPIFVETNCFWSKDDKITKEKLQILKSAGLDGILISVNPFILEYVPFENTERAVRISYEIFGRNLIIYQEFFYYQFKKLNFTSVVPFEDYIKIAGINSLNYIELLPMGRAVYKLGHLFKKFPVEKFFGESCKENLTRRWHTHIDNYGNYITGFCAGISLCNIENIEDTSQINLTDYPILNALVSDISNLYYLGKELGYKEQVDGYISKCHLCVDIRKYIVHQTDTFKELAPKEFYYHLE